MELEWIEGMQPGRVIDGRYEVVGTIKRKYGSTGGVVYEGVSKLNGNRVAIRVINRLNVEDDPRRVVRMERELNIAMKLKHPHMVNRPGPARGV
jgi:hypothetical protein